MCDQREGGFIGPLSVLTFPHEDAIFAESFNPMVCWFVVCVAICFVNVISLHPQLVWRLLKLEALKA